MRRPASDSDRDPSGACGRHSAGPVPAGILHEPKFDMWRDLADNQRWRKVPVGLSAVIWGRAHRSVQDYLRALVFVVCAGRRRSARAGGSGRGREWHPLASRRPVAPNTAIAQCWLPPCGGGGPHSNAPVRRSDDLKRVIGTSVRRNRGRSRFPFRVASRSPGIVGRDVAKGIDSALLHAMQPRGSGHWRLGSRSRLEDPRCSGVVSPRPSRGRLPVRWGTESPPREECFSLGSVLPPTLSWERPTDVSILERQFLVAGKGLGIPGLKSGVARRSDEIANLVLSGLKSVEKWATSCRM